MAIRIITDSASDFEQNAAQERQIDIVPLAVQFGDASYWDGKTITKDQFYKLLQEGTENPTTSQPTPEAFLQRFEDAKEAGDQVVVILLSGVLSGTLQSAAIAKGLCDYEPIYIVDSRSATGGLQLLVDHACKLRDAGVDGAMIAQELDDLKNRLRIIAVIDTLEYLRRGGRLTDFQASLGTMAKLKPVIAVRDGAVVIHSKAFGNGAAVKQLLKSVNEHPIDSSFPMYFLYNTDKSREDLLLPKLQEAGRLETRYCCIGSAIGAHVGPGAFGLAYIEQRG